MAEAIDQFLRRFGASIDRPLRVWILVMAIPFPSLLQALFVIAAEWPVKHPLLIHSNWYGPTAIAVSIGSGFLLIALARLRPAAFAVIATLYAVAQFIWLVYFTLEFAQLFGEFL